MNPAFAERYNDFTTWHWWFRGREHILGSVLRRELSDDGSRVIVSLGCGPASWLDWLVPFAGPGGQVVGVDIDSSHSGSLDQRTAFVASPAEQVGLRSGCADVVLALDLLEHLEDDSVALREAARLARQPGLIVVTVPALSSLWGQQDEVSNHHRRYRKDLLREAFSRAGLPRPRISYFNCILFPPIAAVRWLRRATGAPV